MLPSLTRSFPTSLRSSVCFLFVGRSHRLSFFPLVPVPASSPARHPGLSWLLLFSVPTTMTCGTSRDSGNFLCTPDGRLCVLDMGLMTEVSNQNPRALYDRMMSITNAFVRVCLSRSLSSRCCRCCCFCCRLRGISLCFKQEERKNSWEEYVPQSSNTLLLEKSTYMLTCKHDYQSWPPPAHPLSFVFAS